MVCRYVFVLQECDICMYVLTVYTVKSVKCCFKLRRIRCNLRKGCFFRYQLSIASNLADVSVRCNSLLPVHLTEMSACLAGCLLLVAILLCLLAMLDWAFMLRCSINCCCAAVHNCVTVQFLRTPQH